jgi:hypothetical protein
MSIDTLDPNSPTDLEPAGDGAGHIRTIKADLVEAFPAVGGPITNANGTGAAGDTNPPDDETYSAIFDNVRANRTDVDANRVDIDILLGAPDPEIPAPILDGSIPIGGIILWYGQIVDIPTGFVICDGLNGLTPNLQDRFVVGAGALFTVNETSGGTYLPDKTLVTSEGGAGTGTGTISFPDHILEEDNIPKHSHFSVSLGEGTGDLSSSNAIAGEELIGGSTGPNYKLQGKSTPNAGETSEYGAAASPAALTHPPQDVEVTGVAHTHVYGVPYLALAYIQRIS